MKTKCVSDFLRFTTSYSTTFFLVKESGLNKNEETIALRCQFVVAESSKGPLNPSELIDSLLIPEPRFRHVAEDLGLCRVFRGYENVTDIEWVCFILFYFVSNVSCFTTLPIERTISAAYEALRFFLYTYTKCQRSRCSSSNR